MTALQLSRDQVPVLNMDGVCVLLGCVSASSGLGIGAMSYVTIYGPLYDYLYYFAFSFGRVCCSVLLTDTQTMCLAGVHGEAQAAYLASFLHGKQS